MFNIQRRFLVNRWLDGLKPWVLLGLIGLSLLAGRTAAGAGEVVPRQYLPYLVQPASEVSPEEMQVESYIRQRINEIRASHGLDQLNLAAELTQAARGHSRDMADNGFTGHTGSDGSTPGERIADAGYQAWAWSEIIGWGFGGDSEAMITWWMNSDIHRAMILSSTFEDFGAGYRRDPASGYGHYWTVNFGARIASPDRLPSLDLANFCTYQIEGLLGGSSQIASQNTDCP